MSSGAQVLISSTLVRIGREPKESGRAWVSAKDFETGKSSVREKRSKKGIAITL